MDDKHEVSSSEEEETSKLKRKSASTNDKSLCKKARHPWQIKGSRSAGSPTPSSPCTPQPSSSSSLNVAQSSSDREVDPAADVCNSPESPDDTEITNAVGNMLSSDAIQGQPAGIRTLTYIERWQCQHVAKATVDNAINKTLEEMGVSFNAAENNLYQEQRSRIEDEGVSHAILLQGLQRQRVPMRQWSPIIARLTQVSEMIFSMNMRSRRSVGETLIRGEPEEEAIPTNTNYLLDQAVHAAISGQGLQRQ